MKKIKFLVSIFLCLAVLLGASALKTSAFASTIERINARSALLMDADTGTVVYEQSADEKLQIASMVKIMTLNIIFEEIEKGNLSYDTMVVASKNATSMGGSQAFLDANCEYKTEELIKSIIVASANDSCVAMAEHISGSVDAFVARMNETANKLEMKNTYFVNCTGLPAPNQYSCASDVAKMTKELISHKGFFDFSQIWMFDFTHPSGRVTQLSNTNKLVRFYDGCDGGKTGFTSEAKSCLSATAKRGDTRFICVVIGAESSKVRNAEVSKLLNHGFANYESHRFVVGGEELEERVGVDGGKKSSVKCAVKSDIVIFGNKGENKNCLVEKEFYKVKAPISKGDTVGRIKVVKDGEILAETEIVAIESVKRQGYKDIFEDFVENW